MSGDEDLKVEDDDIVIAADEPEVGQEPPKADEPPKQDAKSAEEGIEDLKRQLEAERAARVQSDRQARENAEEAGRYRTAAERTRADNLANAVDLAAQEVEKQKGAYRAAMEVGDFAAAAEAQTAQTRAAAIEAMAIQERAKYDAQMQARQPSTERQHVVFTPQTQAWIDKHPEFLTDQRFQRRAVAADALAVEEGHSRDTPDYFARIEAIMGLAPQPSPVVERQPNHDGTLAAPVRGAGGSVQGAPESGGRRTYHLSKEEREVADACGISYSEYAKNREAERAERARLGG